MKILNGYFPQQNTPKNSSAKGMFQASFQGRALALSAKAKAAQAYIHLKNKADSPPPGLKQNIDISWGKYETDKIDGITEGIKVFEGVPIAGVKKIFSNGFLYVLLKRGCENACSHCFCRAVPPRENSTEVNTIIWEDFTDLVKGLKELGRRCGQNLIDACKIYPFSDSDPLLLKSFDERGKAHNIAQAVEYFYDALQKPMQITTAGINPDDAWQTKAVLDLEMLRARKPQAVSAPVISVHPFNKLMGQSIKAAMESDELAARGEIEAGKVKAEKSKTFREEYTKRMANTMRAFYKHGFRINSLGLPSEIKEPGLRHYYDNDSLVEETVNKLKKCLAEQGIYDEDAFRQRVGGIKRSGTIANLGRGEKFFGQGKVWTGPLSTGIIDVNGHYLLADINATRIMDTGITLNFRTKDIPAHGSRHYLHSR